MDAVNGYFRQTLRISGEVVSRRIAGESFLIPIRGRLADMQCIFALNPVAEFIWQQVDGVTDLGEIRNRVVARFEVGEAEAGADLRDFVEELLASGLVACAE